MRHGLYKVDLENDVTVYEPNKGDGRIRAYIKSMKCVVSYPKLLMAVHLGRDLDDDEEVHHIDENPLNNDLSNLRLCCRNRNMLNYMARKSESYSRTKS